MGIEEIKTISKNFDAYKKITDQKGKSIGDDLEDENKITEIKAIATTGSGTKKTENDSSNNTSKNVAHGGSSGNKEEEVYLEDEKGVKGGGTGEKTTEDKHAGDSSNTSIKTIYTTDYIIGEEFEGRKIQPSKILVNLEKNSVNDGDIVNADIIIDIYILMGIHYYIQS